MHYKLSEMLIRHKTSTNISRENKDDYTENKEDYMLSKHHKLFCITSNRVTVKIVLRVLFLNIYIKFNSMWTAYLSK